MDSGFTLLNDDLVHRILSRVSAISFAAAACVCKSWKRVCDQILSRPKLTSALSLVPSAEDAVKDVVDRIFSEPIRPHFAIAFVGLQYNLAATHFFLTHSLGPQTPVITNSAAGLIGVDAITKQLKEVSIKWNVIEVHDPNIGELAFKELNFGIVLLVGFVPGLKVEAIPLLRPQMDPRGPMINQFVNNIRDYTFAFSGSAKPAGIIMFGDQSVDLRPILVEMDYWLPNETVIAGDASACFYYKSGDVAQYGADNSYFIDAVALVFAKDINATNVSGEIEFHLALSIGVVPFSPHLEIVAAEVHNASCTWVVTRMVGGNGVLPAQQLIEDFSEDIEDDNYSVYLGIAPRRVGSSSKRPCIEFYEVLGAYMEHFIVDGVGIHPGDKFLFYHSDTETMVTSHELVYDEFKVLRSSAASSRPRKEALGCFVFSCCSRGEPVFGSPDQEAYPFYSNFPDTALAGVFCTRQLGHGLIKLNDGLEEVVEVEDGEEEQNVYSEVVGRRFVNHHSTVYLSMMYTPSG